MAGRKPKKIQYATLNIIVQSAQEQIASRANVREMDDGEKLREIYARRVVMPGVAYLGQDGFRDDGREIP